MKTMSQGLSRIISGLKRFQFQLSSKLLFIWIKPTILGCTARELDIEAGDIVFYVLPNRSIADLLVVNKACLRNGLPAAIAASPALQEARSFFFLGHPVWGRKTQGRPSARMARLFAHQAGHGLEATASLKKNLGKPLKKTIKIVPVSLFWGHQPDREKSIFKLLLSENWSTTSSMKKFLAILFHPKHILVQFGQPVNLAHLMASEQEAAKQMRKLMRQLRVHFNRQKQAIIGPDLSHRRTLLNTILTSPEVKDAIEREASRKHLDRTLVEKRALGYAREIASAQSYRVVRLFDLLLTWLWNHLYNGIEVNGIGKVKELAQSHEIVFTPCHRSHIDYLLLSYVLYHNGLTPPHIAAGKNLNLPLVGNLLRHAGAFFMRRSFQGNALYKAVFDEYLHQMFKKGYSVEYFIEGGRSRTGRTLTPRTGMLSMTIKSLQRDATMPIAFLPVYFGYARVLESATYTAELEGKDKKNESIFDPLKIFSFFKHSFGEVTVNFGEPLLLRDFLDEHLQHWEEVDAISSRTFSQCCVALARQLATRINTAVAIKPTNLVALALVSSANLVTEERHLQRQIKLLMRLAVACGRQGYSLTSLNPEQIITEASSIFGLERREHQFTGFISASSRNLLSLTYNANNVIHIYFLPSLVARYILLHKTTDIRAVREFCLALFPFIQAEMFLPFEASEVEAEVLKSVACLSEAGLVLRQGDRLTATAEGSSLTTAEGSSLTTAEGSLYKPAEDSLHQTAEGSLLTTAEGSLHQTAEGSLLATAEGSLHQTAEDSLLATAEGSLHQTAEGSSLTTAEGSLHQTAEGSLYKTAEGSLSELSRISEPTLVRYYIIIALLMSDARVSSRRLEKAVLEIAKVLALEYGSNSPEFVDTSLYGVFLSRLKQQDLITTENAKLSPGPGFNQFEKLIAATLPTTARNHILHRVLHYQW